MCSDFKPSVTRTWFGDRIAVVQLALFWHKDETVIQNTAKYTNTDKCLWLILIPVKKCFLLWTPLIPPHRTNLWNTVQSQPYMSLQSPPILFLFIYRRKHDSAFGSSCWFEQCAHVLPWVTEHLHGWTEIHKVDRNCRFRCCTWVESVLPGQNKSQSLLYKYLNI